MKKIIILFIVLILLVGCQGIRKGEREIPEVTIHSGTEGVEFGFMKQAPPSDVYEKSTLPIYLEIQNKGAQDTDVEYVLVFEKTYLEVEEQAGKITLRGKTEYDPLGEKQLVQMIADVSELPELKEERETIVEVSICYPYQTLATATVCIDTDPQRVSKKKVCTPGKTSLSGGQGGPVGITSVDTTMIPLKDTVKPQFEIVLKNFQKGSILNKARTTDGCRARIGPAEQLYDLLTIRAYLSDQQLDCEPKGDRGGREAFFRYSDKQNKIKCDLPDGVVNRGNYPAPLRVIIDYGYKETISTKVTIQKI